MPECLGRVQKTTRAVYKKLTQRYVFSYIVDVDHCMPSLCIDKSTPKKKIRPVHFSEKQVSKNLPHRCLRASTAVLLFFYVLKQFCCFLCPPGDFYARIPAQFPEPELFQRAYSAFCITAFRLMSM